MNLNKKKFFILLFILLFFLKKDIIPQEKVYKDFLSYRIIDANSYGIYIKGDKFYRYDFIQKKWIDVEEIPFNIKEIDLSKDIATIDEEGNLWILLSKYLWIYLYNYKIWKSYELPQHLVVSNKLGLIKGIEAWKNNIWIAGSEFLWCFHYNSKWWEQFKYPQNIKGGVLKVGPNNNLWINGIAYYTGKDWKILPPCPIPLDFWRKTSQYFTWDNKGNPWLATVQGVYFFDFKYEIWKKVSKTFHRAYTIAYFDNKIWCVDYGDGIYRYDQNKQKWEKIRITLARPNLSYVYALFSTKNILWVDTFFGIGSYDGKRWKSHYDYTEYYKVHKLFILTLIGVITLLFISIIIFFIIVIFIIK